MAARNASGRPYPHPRARPARRSGLRHRFEQQRL